MSQECYSLFSLVIWGWVGGLGAAVGTLDPLRACFTPQLWGLLSSPGLLDRIQDIYLDLSFPSVSHPMSSFFLIGRDDYFNCFGSTDYSFYNEFRIKTIGSLNPNTFYSEST